MKSETIQVASSAARMMKSKLLPDRMAAAASAARTSPNRSMAAALRRGCGNRLDTMESCHNRRPMSIVAGPAGGACYTQV